MDNLIPDEEQDLTVRAAWLYYVAANNQEETARLLGISRIKVNRLLAQAREAGIVTISIEHRLTEMIEIEETVCRRYGLSFCIATPPLNDADRHQNPWRGNAATPPVVETETESMLARSAVAMAGARFLRGRLAGEADQCIGVGWGRTLAALSQQLSGIRKDNLRFVSLMGSLTRNAAANPFEVVHQLASRTGGEGYFLPVPFMADSVADKQVLMSQRSVRSILDLAQRADFYLISVGECTRSSLIYRNKLISEAEMTAIEKAGAVGDTLGRFFDAAGRLVAADVNDRSLAVDLEALQSHEMILLAAGLEKLDATAALLNSGLVNGLIVDGRIARRIAEDLA